ncbi:protein shortage in chiasmata 1 ortholog isoform X2 [Ranitomeya variabilis]|uniref:protein shortage in chiasmata 1 ortholog isoform X2 n=1 Tax=Ranitomeya variabilis TaxID=490064 RepID=UPI004057A189
MSTVLFPAFKFLSLDYEHENYLKQKLATSWMLIPFPKEILQEEEYFHSNIFVNDLYRTPWKRPIPICKVNEENPVTEVWKRFVPFTDFLEKQSALCKKISTDIVPSSNPCSQVDLEDVYSVPELYVPEDKDVQKECWKTTLPTTLEDYLLPEETVFLNYLAQFGQHVNRLRSLLSRLKTFPVQDPLADWQKNLHPDKMLFRMNTSITGNQKPNMFMEEFHALPPSTKEDCLSVPCTLELNQHSTQTRTQVSDLMTILQLAPEKMSEESGKTNTTGLSTKIYPEDHFIEQITNERNLDPCKEDNVEKAVCFRPYYDYEIEVPMSVPCLKPEDKVMKRYTNLAPEELSPASTTFHITDADTDILECMESHMAGKPLLLKVPLNKDKSQHYTIKELKRRISVNPDTSVGLYLEEDWSKLGLNTKDRNIIEQLKIDFPNRENLNSTETESFKTIRSGKLERNFEEKVSLINQKTNVHKCKIQTSCNNSSLSVIAPLASQSNEIPEDTSNNTDMNTENIKVLRCGEKTDQPKIFCHLLKNVKQYASPTKERVSVTNVSQASKSQEQSCRLYQSLSGGLNVHDTQVKDDCDLLSGFIALRTKQSLGRSECKREENVLSQASDVENNRSSNKENVLFYNVTSQTMPEEFAKYQTLHVTPSASQCHAYQVFQADAKLVLSTLVHLEVLACMEWSFRSVPFDHTRFLLRKQEKIINDCCKSGNKNDKDLIIFENAALLHILVTLRDLVLMCSLDAALEYLCKAMQQYESVLGAHLHDVWRKLRIVQFARDKTKEPNPKITAFLKWMEDTNMGCEHHKVIMLTQMDANTIEEALNNASVKIGGLKATVLYPATKNIFLDTTDVLHSLRSYSCVISKNQYIGSDFPWTHFSLVVEYDCTDYWLQLCQTLNVSHMTLKTSMPNNPVLKTPIHNKHLCHMLIPYVLLSSEELINNSELLHILESRHNMMFIERSNNTSLNLFGKKSHCALITVDLSTVIIIQDLEKLMQDKSAENLILKLVALSLQYSWCWLLLYDKKSNQFEYSLSSDALHSVCLIYAAIIPFTSKSQDMDIKVLMSFGANETGQLIHQIVNYTLMSCNSDPYKWLDRPWLSILISEAEKVLVSFPCINPMVAQLLVHRGSSLQWLLSATNDQLKELFPEVPSKVLKHFSDITANHQLSLSVSSPRSSQNPTRTEKTSKSQSKDNISQPVPSPEFDTFKRSAMSDPSVMFGQSCHMKTDFAKPLKQWTLSDKEKYQSAYLQDNTVEMPFSSGQHSLSHKVSHHPKPVFKSKAQEPSFSINRQTFFADLLSEQNSTNPLNCVDDITNAMCISQPQPAEMQRGPLTQSQKTFLNHPFTASSNEETGSYFSQKIVVAKRLKVNSITTKEGMSEETITQLSQLKRRKLTYEKVPGRCDGQTRLKFF